MFRHHGTVSLKVEVLLGNCYDINPLTDHFPKLSNPINKTTQRTSCSTHNARVLPPRATAYLNRIHKTNDISPRNVNSTALFLRDGRVNRDKETGRLDAAMDTH